VLGPIKARPFGWPRKTRPALTGPVRADDGIGCASPGRPCREGRVGPSGSESFQCLFFCPIQKLRFMFGKLSQLGSASLLIIRMILLY
jgi:hypothetical protein